MILPTHRILNTINLAAHLHRHQSRHDENETPYITHLFSVAMYLASVTDDESVIISGLMHDSLEDVPDYTYEDLVADCGEDVERIVRGVTEDKALPYKERKLSYLEHLKTGTDECVIVSLADKIHNAKSYITMDATKKHDGHMLIFEEVLQIAKSRLSTDHYAYPLVNELEKSITHIKLQ